MKYFAPNRLVSATLAGSELVLNTITGIFSKYLMVVGVVIDQ